MTEITWGEPIDKVLLASLKLSKDTPVKHGAVSYPADHWRFDGVDDYRLPADHPYYFATSKGFTYWPGGENAPDDWDGGSVLLRGGAVIENSGRDPVSWSHPHLPFKGKPRSGDIIGYRRKTEPRSAPALDLTKPVQTRDGRPVRILCTDGPYKDYPVIGFVEADGLAMQWATDGREMLNDHGGRLDLVNAPETMTEWFGLHCSDGHYGKSDRSQCEADATHHLRITWTDGIPKVDVFAADEKEEV